MTYRPITDAWMLCRGKAKYYGSFPAGFLERARYLLGVQAWDPVLHVCGGRVRDYQSGPVRGRGLWPNDATLDLDPSLDPTFLVDARTLGSGKEEFYPGWYPVSRNHKPDGVRFGRRTFGTRYRSFPALLVDRPYTEEDADHYLPGRDSLPNPNDLLRRCLDVVRPGGRVGFLDYYWPRPPREPESRLVALISVYVGWGNRVRCFSVYERLTPNPLEEVV